MERVKYIELDNRDYQTHTKDRKNFACMELNIPSNGDWIKCVTEYAQRIVPNLNLGQANTSKQRELSIVEIDNLSGIIAESACETILRWQFGEENIIKPPSESSVNQIDIKLKTGRTIEVRSSCVRNGIKFAVFAKDRKNPNQQYFDVIGPYSNGYKQGEQLKDYYMRVLYECDKKQFMSLLSKPYLRLYITGGVTKEMMCNKDICQDKHLVPAGGQVQIASDYKVVPLGRSLDAKQFLEVMADENGLIQKHNISL